VIRKGNSDCIDCAQAINYLISYQAYNQSGLSLNASHKILDWTKEIYDANNKELIEWNSANFANLTCQEAKDFINERLKKEITAFERQELTEALTEIRVRSQ